MNAPLTQLLAHPVVAILRGVPPADAAAVGAALFDAGWRAVEVPLNRPGTVDEIAHAVLFFAAQESSYITGQTLCVDGGWTAGGFLRDF